MDWCNKKTWRLMKDGAHSRYNPIFETSRLFCWLVTWYCPIIERRCSCEYDFACYIFIRKGYLFIKKNTLTSTMSFRNFRLMGVVSFNYFYNINVFNVIYFYYFYLLINLLLLFFRIYNNEIYKTLLLAI